MSFCQLCGHFSFQSAIYRLLLQLPSWAAPLGAWPLSIRRVPFLCGLWVVFILTQSLDRSYLPVMQSEGVAETTSLCPQDQFPFLL